MCVDGYKTYLGPILLYDPVHTLGLLWRLLINKDVRINSKATLNKLKLVDLYEKEKGDFRKARYH